ncbi:hypothetical protein QEN19_001916 [Hanseniaspora menglaensis]
MFKQIAAVSGAVAFASAAYNATSTVSENTTTLVTITSCEDNACHLTTSAALVSIATVTIEGTVTEYTTYCPLTATTSANTTVVPTVVPTTSATKNSTVSSEYTGAAAKALPAAGALIAGAAALLL